MTRPEQRYAAKEHIPYHLPIAYFDPVDEIPAIKMEKKKKKKAMAFEIT